MTRNESLYQKIKIYMENKKVSQSAGFEPARGDPIGFQVQRLNHSATTAKLEERGILMKQCNLERIYR